MTGPIPKESRSASPLSIPSLRGRFTLTALLFLFFSFSLFLSYFFPFSFCFCFCFCFLRRFPFSDRVDPLMKETVASWPPRSPLVAFTVGCWLRIFSTHHDHCGFLLCSFMGLQAGTGLELIRACAKVASIKRPIFKRCYCAQAICGFQWLFWFVT